MRPVGGPAQQGAARLRITGPPSVQPSNTRPPGRACTAAAQVPNRLPTHLGRHGAVMGSDRDDGGQAARTMAGGTGDAAAVGAEQSGRPQKIAGPTPPHVQVHVPPASRVTSPPQDKAGPGHVGRGPGPLTPGSVVSCRLGDGALTVGVADGGGWASRTRTASAAEG